MHHVAPFELNEFFHDISALVRCGAVAIISFTMRDKIERLSNYSWGYSFEYLQDAASRSGMVAEKITSVSMQSLIALREASSAPTGPDVVAYDLAGVEVLTSATESDHDFVSAAQVGGRQRDNTDVAYAILDRDYLSSLEAHRKVHPLFSLSRRHKRQGLTGANGTSSGAMTVDAVHRTVLLRFPSTAEKIKGQLDAGLIVERVEVVLDFDGTEIVPEGYVCRNGSSLMMDVVTFATITKRKGVL